MSGQGTEIIGQAQDQAGNVGTILRLAACLGVPVDIVELGLVYGCDMERLAAEGMPDIV